LRMWGVGANKLNASKRRRGAEKRKEVWKQGTKKKKQKRQKEIVLNGGD